MKKTSLLYTAACLLSSMTLCLSGCGDDDPIIETPPVENPKPEPKPEPGPEKSMIDMYMLQFGYENEYIKSAGDSLAFYDLLEKRISFMQDSVKNAGGSLDIKYMKEMRIVGFFDSTGVEDVTHNAYRNLLSYIKDEVEKSYLGFVYTGAALSKNKKIELSIFNSEELPNYISKLESSMTFGLYLPNVEATVWTTTDETTAIRSLNFPNKYVANVNDDSSVSYSWKHSGYDITLTAEKEKEEKYAFLLNTEGTEIRLVRIDGKAVENGAVYTCPNFSKE